MSRTHRVVIIGGGFAGLAAARALKRAPVEVTLVDRSNHHLFQPLLYQVATGGLSPADISAPLRGILRRQRNVRVVMEEAVDFEVEERRALLAHGELPYETLIVAVGVRHSYFGNSSWEAWAPGLKTVEDATAIRSRVLRAFEQAERATDPAERLALLTFVVVGGGATGVELAGAIGELAGHTLRHDFRQIHPAEARVLLVEGAGRVLPSFNEDLSAAAKRSLTHLGVEVLVDARVEEVMDGAVVLRSKDERSKVEAATVLWAAGVEASPLGRKLAAQTGVETDEVGRLLVEPDCTLPGHPEIIAIGDVCHLKTAAGSPLPGLAPVAMQQGLYAGRLVVDRLAGRTRPPFRYRDKGSLAVIGRAAAVADLGSMRATGYLAWLLWLFVHIMYLVGFENRILVLLQWAYSYFTRGRTARLITGPDPRAGSDSG